MGRQTKCRWRGRTQRTQEMAQTALSRRASHRQNQRQVSRRPTSSARKLVDEPGWAARPSSPAFFRKREKARGPARLRDPFPLAGKGKVRVARDEASRAGRPHPEPVEGCATGATAPTGCFCVRRPSTGSGQGSSGRSGLLGPGRGVSRRCGSPRRHTRHCR